MAPIDPRHNTAPARTEAPEMRAGLPGDEVRRRLAGAARHEEIGRRVLAFYLVEMALWLR